MPSGDGPASFASHSCTCVLCGPQLLVSYEANKTFVLPDLERGLLPDVPSFRGFLDGPRPVLAGQDYLGVIYCFPEEDPI